MCEVRADRRSEKAKDQGCNTTLKWGSSASPLVQPRAWAAGEIGRIEIGTLQLAAGPGNHAIADIGDARKTSRNRFEKT
jgi:hypothetical protein